jgi:hypothetical protein
MPPKIADGGLFAGIVLLIVGTTMPNVHLTPLVIVFFIAGCLCFGAAAHFATRDAPKVETENPQKPANTMGPIINNSGINTQGQQGDNVIGKK